MGAVAAVLFRTGTPDPDRVRRMLAASPHRGTDYQIIVHGRCAIGVSNSAARTDASLARAGDVLCGAAGLFDNIGELAGDRAGHANPAQVVATLFEAEGDTSPRHLRGQFSAVLTDGERLWFFRDHFAFAHLFYRDEPGSFLVATEAKQVVAGSSISREPDVEVVERLFYGSFDYGDLDRELPCALKGVRRLPKATTVTVDGARVSGRRYWNPEPLIETGRYEPSELKARFDALMSAAVARTLTGADVVSLSGGIDSPAVAAFAARNRGGGDLAALSAVFPEFPSVDERPLIEIVAKHLNIPLHVYSPKARPLDDIEDWVRVCDGPAPVLPAAQAAEHFVRARELGLPTMLSGEQAELVFDMRAHALVHLAYRGKLSTAMQHVRDQRALGASVAGIAKQLVSAFIPRAALAGYQRYRPLRGGTPDWLDPRPIKEATAEAVIPARKRWRHFQMGIAAGPGIGLEADEICQEVCGVRLRRPWADVDLFELFVSLPAEVKFPRAGGKALVRSLLRGTIPDEIVERKDRTFFNEYVMGRIQYPDLRKLLLKPKHRLKGVRYDLLADRLEREDLSLADYKWALDLAKSHAFLSQW